MSENDIQEVHQCTNVDGDVRCTSTETMPCFLEVENDPAKADDWLCDEHIRHSGYCMGCGQFWGGIESFDFGNGFCEHCNAEFDDNYDDDYDDDYGAIDYDDF